MVSSSRSTRGGSTRSPRRNNGLATLEPIFVAGHPTSSHFLATGFQDNGTQVRVGDTVWEETFEGDGGGTVFHPIRSDIIVTQWTAAIWNGSPASAYFDPITRLAGLAGTEVRENAAAAFYSGAAVVADTLTTARLALGTNRVWITDNLGGALPLRWRVLPYPPVTTEQDARNGAGGDLSPNFGVPNIVNNNFVGNGGVSTADQVIDMTWQSGSVLLVIYQGGLVRYTNTNKAAGNVDEPDLAADRSDPVGARRGDDRSGIGTELARLLRRHARRADRPDGRDGLVLRRRHQRLPPDGTAAQARLPPGRRWSPDHSTRATRSSSTPKPRRTRPTRGTSTSARPPACTRADARHRRRGRSTRS